MSIFSSIMNKIFHHGSSPSTSAGGSGAQVASAAAPSTASGGTGAGGQTVDVEVVLSGMEKNAGQKLDWRHSIVDLMKLFNLDSGLSTRKELAQELGHTGDMNDSASMNGLTSRSCTSWPRMAARFRTRCGPEQRRERWDFSIA